MLELSVSAAAPDSAMSAVELSTAVTLVAVTFVALAARPVSRPKIRSPEIVAAAAPSTTMPTEDGGDGPAITLFSIRGLADDRLDSAPEPGEVVGQHQWRAAEPGPISTPIWVPVPSSVNVLCSTRRRRAPGPSSTCGSPSGDRRCW